MTALSQKIDLLIPELTVRNAVERVAREIGANPEKAGFHVVTIMQGGLWFSESLARSPALDGHIAENYRVRAKRTVTDGELGPVAIDPLFEQTDLRRLANKPVLLVDDILDEGKTLQALATLIAPVTSRLRTAVLIRRARPEGHAITPDYVGLDTEEQGWLVGCGMDSNGRYRDLPYIGVQRDAEAGRQPA